jgi:prepilin-type N-terminal cleavage/methylation domain-containing protein
LQRCVLVRVKVLPQYLKRYSQAENELQSAFTLIELSIVLVIIGLIVGGVLVGRDLIGASTVRAQISQMEKLQTAVHTFRGKFNALPGDMNVTTATQFGFPNANCSGADGLRNGDFLITNSFGEKQGGGETGLFWGDLSDPAGGRLIEGSFTSSTCTSTPTASATQYNQYFPEAKIGRSNSIVIIYDASGLSPTAQNKNYFTVEQIQFMSAGNTGGGPGMTVAEAFKIDSKIDDGKPQSGTVNALQLIGASVISWSFSLASDGATTCFNTTNYTYSLSYNNGAQVTCSLSFEIK